MCLTLLLYQCKSCQKRNTYFTHRKVEVLNTYFFYWKYLFLMILRKKISLVFGTTYSSTFWCESLWDTPNISFSNTFLKINKKKEISLKQMLFSAQLKAAWEDIVVKLKSCGPRYDKNLSPLPTFLGPGHIVWCMNRLVCTLLPILPQITQNIKWLWVSSKWSRVICLTRFLAGLLQSE